MSEAVQVLQPDNQLSFFKGSDVVCEKEGDNWWELESSKKVLLVFNFSDFSSYPSSVPCLWSTFVSCAAFL